MQDRNKNINKRTNVFSILVIIVFLVLIGRLFQLQILKGESYKRMGENQYFFDTGEHFDRGSIFFTDKNKNLSPAVAMYNEYDLAIDPKTANLYFTKRVEEGKKLEDLKNTLYANILKSFDSYNFNLELDSSLSSENNLINFLNKEDFFKKLEKTESSYEFLIQNIPESVAEDLISQNLRGLIVNRKKTRIYFEDEVGAKVLGFVGFKENSKAGLYGLEKYYNDVLEKKDAVSNNFFAEIFLDFDLKGEKSFSTSKLLQNISSEGDINLTIDVNLERYLNKTLAETKERWSSSKIGGIVMDINDGSILAMEELPSYNPNDYSEVSSLSLYNNDLISGVYEMGSIIKPLTVATALDLNLIDENSTYNDTGSVVFNGYRIYNYDKRARGTNTSIQKILSESLNVGIAYLVEKMGQDNFREYFYRFGFGEYTGIDLPSETDGLVDNLDSKIMIDTVTAGYGQGIATTPIQTIRALATLGNGGRLVTPHIVESVSFSNGLTKVIAKNVSEPIFQNPDTSERISKILIEVVDDAMNVKNPLYTIAAKTGTAQVPNPETGKYYEDKYLHSFFGYFPATNPKYIIFLYQLDPKEAEYASQTLKDTFFSLVDFITNYYQIPPDRDSYHK